MDLMNDNNSQDGDQSNHRVGDNGLESKKEPFFPSYDFQPIRPNSTYGLSHSALDLAGSTRDWAPSSKSYGSIDSLEPTKCFVEKDKSASEAAIISAVERTMKAHADNLLHVMEGVSARLKQLETRTRNLENLVDDVKVSVGNSHGNTDGKLRHLENILLEVQSGVQVLKDKQEIVEAQLQLSKLQVSKQSETHSTRVEPTAQPPATLSQQPASPSLPQQNLPPVQFIQPLATQHSLPPPSSQLSQLPNQFVPQQEPYYPPPSQSQPPPSNQPPYQAPPTPPNPNQSLHQPPYQSPPQQPQYPQQQPPPQLQQTSSGGYNPEEPPYPVQSYPPRQPPSHPPPGSAPSQQYYSGPPTPPSMYDGPGGRSNSGFASGYSPEPYSYTGQPSSQFGNSPSLKPPHQSGSGSGYPQLPMARPLPQQALQMASAVSSGGSESPRSGSRVPVDDVIDKVVSMGFPRDQVRGTVRTLTENGQNVDLNIVLDKLMNGERGGQQQQQQPARGWYGGGH